MRFFFCKNIQLILLIVFFSFLSSHNSHAKRLDHCIQHFSSPPCNGAAGTCTINPDGSWGGFVADSATRELQEFWHLFSRTFINVGHISISAAVCDEAFFGEGKLEDGTVLFEQAQVFKGGVVSAGSRVHGKALVYHNGLIPPNKDVSGFTLVTAESPYLDSNPHPDPTTEKEKYFRLLKAGYDLQLVLTHAIRNNWDDLVISAAQKMFESA